MRRRLVLKAGFGREINLPTSTDIELYGMWVTGDYRRAREPRLTFVFDNGRINTYNCSVKILETAHAKRDYDFSIDIMSSKWDADVVKKLMKKYPEEEIADVLLDQEIFAGVGNIIKNEVLAIQHLAPQHLVRDLAPKQRNALVAETRAFSKQFYQWRKKFELRKHLKVHQKGTCPYCGSKLIRHKTGRRQRWSYWCPIDQT